MLPRRHQLIFGRKPALRSSHQVSFRPRFGLKRVLENFSRFGGKCMLRRFPGLWKFLVRIVEVGAAGCASALVAFMLDHSHRPSIPPAPTMAEVKVVPVPVPILSATIPPPILTQAPPAESQPTDPSHVLRSESSNPSTLPAPKPAKTAARRETKHAPQNPELKARTPESKPVQTGMAPSTTPAQTAGVAGGEQLPTNLIPSEPGSSAGHRSSWIVPLSDPPRPPRGVGEVVSGAM
jgi:hypothetical protein